MTEKPAFRIDKDLLKNDEVLIFLDEHPLLNIQGLIKISYDTIRIFYNDEQKRLTSELIKINLDK